MSVLKVLYRLNRKKIVSLCKIFTVRKKRKDANGNDGGDEPKAASAGENVDNQTRDTRTREEVCHCKSAVRTCSFLLGASDSGLALKSGVVFAGITHHESVQFVCGCIFPTLTLPRLRHGVETH